MRVYECIYIFRGGVGDGVDVYICHLVAMTGARECICVDVCVVCV